MKKQNVVKVALVARAPKTKGKSKNKNHKPEVEQLRDEIRTLKATVRHLKKMLARQNKDSKRIEELEELVQENMEQPIDSSLCEECGKGYVELVALGPKHMLKCNNCSYWRLDK